MSSLSGPLDVPDQGLAPSPRVASLRNNSVARLASDLLGVVFSLAAATVAARLLGPAGKGYYSSLLLLGGLFIQCFGAGLGEAAIVLAGRGQASLETAVSGTMLAILPLSVLAGLLFWLTATVVLHTSDPERGTAVLLASVLVALNTSYTTIVSFLVARERVMAVAVLAILSNGSATVALWFLLGVRGGGVGPAILASALGAGAGLVATIGVLRRARISLRPGLVRDYLRAAFRLGVALQVSNLLVLLTARLDLILVYRWSGATEAGGYSVALTIGALVGSAPIAVSYASFPRLATLDDARALLLTLQVFRIGIAAAISAAAVLAAASPVVIPLVFGRAYTRAISPTMLLVPAGVLWSGQWLLCRASAARGLPRPLLVSFTISFLAMVALDLVLIGPYGAVGAAVAATVSPALGLAAAVRYYRADGWQLARLLPGRHDFVDFVRTGRSMVTRGRPAVVEAPPD